MKTPRHRIAGVLAQQSLKPDFNAQDFSRQLAAYLLSENRTNELNSLLRDIMQKRAEKGIVEVVALSAHELSAEAETQIRETVRELHPKAEKIIISPVRDKNIIGSIRLELPNQQLDLSVRGKLNRFKQRTFAHGAF